MEDRVQGAEGQAVAVAFELFFQCLPENLFLPGVVQDMDRDEAPEEIPLQ